MTFKDICTKKTYTVNGQEKTIWLNVGTLRKTDDGKEFIELNVFPDTAFYVFDKKPKEEKKELSEQDKINIENAERIGQTLTDEELESLKAIPF